MTIEHRMYFSVLNFSEPGVKSDPPNPFDQTPLMLLKPNLKPLHITQVVLEGNISINHQTPLGLIMFENGATMWQYFFKPISGSTLSVSF